MKKTERNVLTSRKRGLAASLALLMLLTVVPLSALANSSLPSAMLVSANGAQNGMVRVFLSSMGNPSALDITVQGSYTVNGKSTKTIASGTTVRVNFNASTGKLTLVHNGVSSDMGNAFKLRRHQTSGANGVKIAQGRVPSNLYPGDVSFVVKANGTSYKLYTIVYVYMEDYLYGVLPYEMGNSAHLEALKAQAVSARTYTLRAMQAATNALYDVVDTTSDQVYSGTASGNLNCKAAVDATKGIVSMNGSTFTGTWYTASNGGQIESVKNLWGSSGYSYIKVKDDPYDLANPDSRVKSFTVNATGTQGNSALGSLLSSKAAATFGAGAVVTGVNAIVPHTPKYADPSRLFTKIDFAVTYTLHGTSKTGTLTFSIFDELETPLGMSISTAKNELWTVTKTTAGFRVEARRYGHGTGMSQRGAMYMGKLGYTYDQILAFYFEGCKRVQYTLTNTILSPVVTGMDSYEVTTEEEAAELEQDDACRAIVQLSMGSAMAMRTNPSAEAETLCLITGGAEVSVLGETGDWCLIQYGKIKGYVKKASLSISGTMPTLTQSATVLAGYGQTTSSLNLRASADASSASLSTLAEGTVLPLLSVSNGWAYTQYGRLNGYVSMNYIKQSTTYPEASYDADAVSAKITDSAAFYLDKSLNGYVIMTLPAGTEVAFVSGDESWTEVRYNKMTGYVLTDKVQRTYQSTAQSAQDLAGAGESYARVTNSTALNLREAANTASTIMTEMPFNTRLIVESKGSAWSRVRYRGVAGYAMNSYLTFESAPDTDLPDGTTLQAVVTTESGSLNLRQSKSTNAAILAHIPKGTTISILEKGNDWCKTTYDGHTGYVVSSFLTFVQSSTPTPTPTNTPTPTPTDDGDQPENPGDLYAKVGAEGAALRSKPLDGSALVITLPAGVTLSVHEQTQTWAYVTYEGHVGYVRVSDITFVEKPTQSTTPTPTPTPTATPTSTPTATPTPTPETPIDPEGPLMAKVTTAGSSLNLRLRPLSNSQVLERMPNGSVVTVLELGTNWCLLEYETTKGYAQTKYLTILGGNPALAPAITVVLDENIKNDHLDNSTIVDDVQQDANAAQELTPTPAPAPVNQTQASEAGDAKENAKRDKTLHALSEPLYVGIQVSWGRLNLRGGCSKDSELIAKIDADQTVLVLERGEEWCLIEYEDKQGYVMTKYLVLPNE